MVTTRSRKAPLMVLVAVVVAVGINAGVAALAHTLSPSPGFMPLNPIAYVPYTVFGVIVGAIGWSVVRRNVQQPAKVLRRLVPMVLVLSFVPDFVLYSVSTVGFVSVLALMTMHVVVAAVGVWTYLRAMPLPVPDVGLSSRRSAGVDSQSWLSASDLRSSD